MKMFWPFKLIERNTRSDYECPLSFSEKRYKQLPENEREELEKLRQRFCSQFKDLEQKQASELCKQIKEMIYFAQSRVGEWQQNRSISIRISLGMLAFSVAGLGLIADPNKVVWYIYPLAIPFLCGLLVTSLISFAVLWRQIKFWYPFIDVAKPWRWFYLYAISREMPFKSILNKSEKTLSRRLFLDGLNRYAEKTLKLDHRSELMQDIEQLYLLLAYEGYTVQFSIEVNRILVRGIKISMLITLISGMATFGYWFFCK